MTKKAAFKAALSLAIYDSTPRRDGGSGSALSTEQGVEHG
jgi:hypothetical protein